MAEENDEIFIFIHQKKRRVISLEYFIAWETFAYHVTVLFITTITINFTHLTFTLNAE